MSNVTVTDTKYYITVAETNTSVTVETGDAINVFVDTFSLATDVQNTGTGAEIGRDITGDTLRLRKINNSDGDIVITENTGDITLDLADTITANVTGQVSDISNHSTTDLSEGTNLYYTDTRARLAISASGSLTYNSSTGEISYTQPVNVSEFTNDAGYITDYTETDPVFTASVAGGITSGDITNWNTAYGWGDHASGGYLTSYTETDPVYTASSWYSTTNNSENWNTAYGWGDHSIVGYLTDLSGQTTDNLSEGSNNLYYTQVRADNAIANYTGNIGLSGLGGINTIVGGTANFTTINGDLNAANINSSGTNLTIDPNGFLLADTNEMYVGSLTQAVKITDTGITNLGSTALTFTGDLVGDVTGQVSDVSNHTSDNISEGTTNVYHTTARVQTVIDTNSAGFITDYTVTESDVTQHQAALSITESQISDLSHYTDADARTAISLNSSNTNELSYDSATGVISYTSPSTVGSTGQVVFAVRNASGVAIARGEAVYIAGHSGSKILVAKADANGVGTIPAVGLANSAMNNNTDGSVLISGEMTSLDTSSFSVGDVLYVSETPGQLTATRPTADTSKVQNIGKVARSDNQNGIIIVSGSGRANDIPNLPNGEVFIGNGGSYETRTLTTDDVSEGSNLYYTDGRVNTVLSSTPISTFTNDVGYLTSVPAPTYIAHQAKNVGSALSRGDVVYIHSYSSSTTQVKKMVKGAIYTDSRPIIAWGIANEDLATNATGQFIIQGYMTGLNTNNLVEGRALYISDGSTHPWDNDKGYGDDLQQIGFCVQEDTTAGIIYVDIKDPVSHTSTLEGDITINGHFIPSANVAHDLGSPTRAWRDIYVGPGSLYVDGQKIVSSDEGTIDITTDTGQNLNIQAGEELTLLSLGEVTHLTDATLNLGPTTQDGVINIRGTLEAPDVHVGDLEIDPTLINNTAVGQNLEIRTDGFLHANVADVYVGTLTNYTKIDEASIQTSADWLTLNNDVDVTSLIKVNDGYAFSSFNPYAGFGGTAMPTTVMGIGQEEGWSGLTIRSRGEHDWGLSGFGINPDAPRSLLALSSGRLDGSSDDYLNSGDKFASVLFNPYSGYRTGTEWLTPSVELEVVATEDHSSSGMGTKLVIHTTDNGNFAGSTDTSHANKRIEIQGTTITTNDTLKLDDDVQITGELTGNGAGTLNIGSSTKITGNASSKTTTIGDSQVSNLYDIHGFKVEAGDTAWASVTLDEHVGGNDKPAPAFSNPVVLGQVWGGTPSSQSAVPSGKRLITIAGQGSYDDGTGTIVQPSTSPFRMLAETTQEHTSSARGTKFQIETTPDGSTTRNTVLFQGDEVVINQGGGDGVISGGANLKLGSQLDTNNNNIINSGGDVVVDDNLKVNSTLTVDGQTNLNGNVNLGNANTDLITATGYLKASNGFGFTVLNTATANYLSGVLGIISQGDAAYITDGDSGNPCLAVYTGSAWKRIALGSDISSS